MTRRRQLTLELLEARDLLATFGVPWPNAQHLTVSFAHDGSQVDGVAGNLFQTLNNNNSTTAWMTEIARAYQTWANQANINIGFVQDNGAALDVAGPIQTAQGRGDLRVAAHGMPSDVLAVSTPYDLMANSRAGDMVLNSSASFGIGNQAAYDLYSVALHEVGLSLGLSDSTDPSAAMYRSYNGIRTGLGSEDVTRIQALYGARQLDSFVGNHSFPTAAVVTQPAFTADIGAIGETDYYAYKLPVYSKSTVTFKVQTAGVSFLQPQLAVLNDSGQVVGTAVSSSPLSGEVSVQIDHTHSGAVYYLKVQGATSDVFGMGGYRVKLDTGPVSQLAIAALDTVYSGTLYNDPQVGGHKNIPSALDLTQPFFRADGRFYYAATESILNSVDTNYNKVVVPGSTTAQPFAMQVCVEARTNDGLYPAVRVLDQLGNPVSVEVLTNDRGAVLVQVPQAVPSATYYVQVSPATQSSGHNTGAYLLGVNFSVTPLTLSTLLAGSVDSASPRSDMVIQAQETQYTHFVLSNDGASSTTVRFGIFDTNNNLIQVLSALGGQTVSANIYLPAGFYKTRVLALTQNGLVLPTVPYRVKVDVLSDPIDPPPGDPGSLPPPSVPPIVVVGGGDPMNPPPDPPPPGP